MNLGLLRVAWRNTVRSFPRRWPVLVILASAVALLQLGNTLFESSTSGLERTYVRSFSSELTISARSEEGFNIFGNELPLIGEYQVLPVLPNATEWMARVEAQGARALGQVTAGGALSIGSWTKGVPLFGVDLPRYFAFFPDLKVVQGDPGAGAQRALMLNEAQYEEVSRALGAPPALGTAFTLTVFNDHSFSIREVKLVGVYRYPVRDAVLDRIALVDPDTARSLNGYIYGAPQDNLVPALGTSTDELNSLFEGMEDLTTSEDPGLTEKVVADRLADTTARDAQTATVAGSWNFVLTQGPWTPPHDPSVQVRGWRDTSGGNALVVWLLQVLFNAGLIFVTVAAALVGINSLALSIAERNQELGTLRALGATKTRVAGLVMMESLFMVAGAGLVGVLGGAVLVVGLGRTGIELTNPYLQALFGAPRLYPHLSLVQMMASSLFSLGLGLVATVIPVRRTLGVTPGAAMARS